MSEYREHVKDYTTDFHGNVAVPNLRAGFLADYAEKLPVILGAGVVRKLAIELADEITQDARTVHGPVVWITGNAYMPPLRDLAQAEIVWQAENNRDGELWAWFVEMVEGTLRDNDVALECPDYDNALYAVDLQRWQYREDTETTDAEDLNDEWEPRTVE